MTIVKVLNYLIKEILLQVYPCSSLVSSWNKQTIGLILRPEMQQVITNSRYNRLVSLQYT